MAMSTDRDDATMRRYREANAALDEGPSAATRAAILAAAARHVAAKPQAADAPRAAHRRRWPFAAAAAVLLSTLAVMMAQRTEQEMPTFTAPAERSQEKVAVAPAQLPEAAPASEHAARESQTLRTAPGASARPPQTSAKNEVLAEAPARALERGARVGKPASADAASDSAKAESRMPEAKSEPLAIPAEAVESRARTARDHETVSAEARRAVPAAPAAAPPPPAAEKSGAGLGAADSARDGGPADATPAYRAARKEIAPAPAAAPAAQGAVRHEMQRDAELPAKDWIDRIVRLRGEGRHADADAELKRFRERYPDAQVPPAALPPATPVTGTR
jgi:hypothetical protein